MSDAKGQLVGIVTEGDFLRRGEIGTQRRRPRWLEFLVGPGRLATEYVRACGRKVDEIMTTESRPRKSAQDDKWSFCLTAGTLWPANQERPCNDDRAETTHRPSRQR